VDLRLHGLVLLDGNGPRSVDGPGEHEYQGPVGIRIPSLCCQEPISPGPTKIATALQAPRVVSGNSFSDARRELDRLYLQHPSLGLTMTASLLGYEDPTPFSARSRSGKV
jgi:hypothetical protein